MLLCNSRSTFMQLKGQLSRYPDHPDRRLRLHACILRAFPESLVQTPRMKTFLLTACMTVVCAAVVAAADDNGFVPLFNGRDLNGWVNANCAPETWSVREGMIPCTGRPTGAMRTTRQYENFIMEVEWRHLTSGGNSGGCIWGSPSEAAGVPVVRGMDVLG